MASPSTAASSPFEATSVPTPRSYGRTRGAARVRGEGGRERSTVHVATTYQRTDTEIAQAAVSILTWHTVVPDDRVTVTVKTDGSRSQGTLDWQYQKDAAARAVRDLIGVQGVTNDIRVQPHVKTTDVRAKIEAAFTRSAEIDARRVSVTAQDGTVVLSGNVRSWAERRRRNAPHGRRRAFVRWMTRITVVP